MQALDRKLLRDFARLWKQALAIAMVLACGVAILLMALGTYKSLSDTRETYYERNRFADVFSAVKRPNDAQRYQPYSRDRGPGYGEGGLFIR